MPRTLARKCDRCRLRGPHLCTPRYQRAIQFFERVLVHTKGPWARKPFLLSRWQRDDIIVPLFGRVEFSDEFGVWTRQYRIAWMEVARKNGKSELLAGIALLLLVADDEEGGEIYGCACDTQQARKVFDVAARMVQLSPVLSKRLRTYSVGKRIVDDRTASYYEVIAADAAGNLGHNPHGIIFDEVLSQPDGSLWDVMRTGMGARTQPLMIGATTAGDDLHSFCAAEHDYCQRVAADAQLDPRRLVYIRNTPMDADPWDERNWYDANPALGEYLSVTALRDEALEARNDPTKEHGFRQFRLNQWQTTATRAIPDYQWDACVGVRATDPAELDARAVRQRCFGGLDLSAKTDLTALCWVFPDLGNLCLWRYWVPEDQIDTLDRLTGGRMRVWVRDGWIVATPGAVIDYDAVYAQIDADRQRYRVVDLNHDPMMAAPIMQELQKRGLIAVQVSQGFALTEPIKEVMRLVQSQQLVHGGNPVTRWNVDSVEVKQDDRERLQFVKPRRGATGKRIDGFAALVFAVDGVMRRGKAEKPRRTVAGF